MHLAFDPNWTCAKTGDCCRSAKALVMTQLEWTALRSHRPEIRADVDLDGPMVKLTWTEACPYLGADNLCQVHEVRPVNCRRFMCLRAPGEPFMEGGPMGCQNLSLRVLNLRSARRFYAQHQRKVMRSWGHRHGWTPEME